MKWIGQHIYDLISRFRNDVYLEDIDTGTIASGGNLGLDSNNKIVKATEATGDLTSIVAGTGLSGTSLTGPIPTLNVDASQTQITAIGIIGTGQWRGDAINAAYLEGQSGTNTGDETLASINALDITEVGTIDSGVWEGTAIATAYIADDAVTFAKAQGVTPNVYGNTIKILPSDFMVNEDVDTSPLNFKDGSNSGVQVADGASEMIAFVAIPQGMKATALDIYSTHAKTVKVYELDVNASFNFNTATPNETGSANTQITIDPAINSTAINYLVITYVSTATTNRVWGGLLTIAAI
jgi:hypothetical protein